VVCVIMEAAKDPDTAMATALGSINFLGPHCRKAMGWKRPPLLHHSARRFSLSVK
jgi:hypothetical protein